MKIYGQHPWSAVLRVISEFVFFDRNTWRLFPATWPGFLNLKDPSKLLLKHHQYFCTIIVCVCVYYSLVYIISLHILHLRKYKMDAMADHMHSESLRNKWDLLSKWKLKHKFSYLHVQENYFRVTKATLIGLITYYCTLGCIVHSFWFCRTDLSHTTLPSDNSVRES